MSQAPHLSARSQVNETQARIHRATQAFHPLDLACAANCALLDTPAAQGSIPWTETGGVYSVSYVRNPGARFLRLEARVSAAAAGASIQLKLTARDASGHSVINTDDRIPRGFKDEVTTCPIAFIGPLFEASRAVIGYLDLDEVDDTLTDPSWSLDFELSVSGGGALDGVTVWELPRFVVDDSATHGGVIPGVFQRDAVIHDGATDGLERLLATLASARLVNRTYLSLSWRQATLTGEVPSLTSTSDGPFDILAAGASRVDFGVTPRVVQAASVAGEAAQFRFLYRFEGGAGTETATVKLHGSATGSPWTKTVAYTASWTWSAWVDAAVRTSPATDALSPSGLVSASGPTLWLAGLHVRETIT